jgi:hypothetical protein
MICGEDGVTDFDRLRAAIGRMGSRDAFPYTFDLLDHSSGCLLIRSARMCTGQFKNKHAEQKNSWGLIRSGTEVVRCQPLTSIVGRLMNVLQRPR